MNAIAIRRATSDDLEQLTPLWQMEGLAADELAPRFTEFIVAVDADNRIHAAIGLNAVGDQGELHSEVIGVAENGDQLRSVVWPKLKLICQGYGLLRLWTRLGSPFWRAQGFHHPKPAIAEQMPGEFGVPDPDWLVMPLKGSDALAESVDRHMTMLRAMNEAETERTREMARRMKFIAGILLVLVGAMVAIWSLVLFRVLPGLKDGRFR